MKLLNILATGILLSSLFPSISFSQETTSKPVAKQSDDAGLIALIRDNSQKITTAFNSGRADEIASMYLPTGELIDEAGTIYQGQEEIKNVMTEVFKRFPGTVLTIKIDSIRIVGPIGIEEGTRILTAKDGVSKSQFRYISVWGKVDSLWKIASNRDITDNPTPTSRDFLQPLEWLVGDWVNEGSDGSVAISYKWSEDKNYLLGEFKMSSAANARTSSQRICWDANSGRIRSWLFDADGGFSEGNWNVMEDGIVIKSTSTNPDGSTASATLNLVQKDKDHFTFSGSDRIVGSGREPDFELNVTRRLTTVNK